MTHDGPEGEPRSPYFGDYPDGAYWSAHRDDPPDDLPRGTGPRRRAPWASTEERTPANPYRVRMFAEIGCDFALWGEPDEPPPTTRPDPHDEDGAPGLEHELPLSAELRAGLRAWGLDFFRSDGGDRSVVMDDFDERGFRLSRELQRQLGDRYTVEYHFEARGPHREALLASVADDPLPGWSCR